MQTDCLDGVSNDGFDALVVGRRRERDARSQTGRSVVEAGALVMSTLRELLLCTDSWNAYLGSIWRAFREKVKETAGRGRACLRGWRQVCIGVVIKRKERKRGGGNHT
jgi:hypothetical protein